MKQFYVIILSLITLGSFAQVGIGTTLPTGALDIQSTNNGVVIPRIALTSRIISAPVVNPQGGAVAAGTLIWNTATAGTAPNNVVPGFYYWNAGAWNAIAGSPTRDWTIGGNVITNPTTEFIGTTSNHDFKVRTNDSERFTFTSNGRLLAHNDGTSLIPMFSWNSDQDIGMYRIDANTFGFSTAGVERMRFLADGRVSINDNNPPTYAQLTVRANGSIISRGVVGIGTTVGLFGQSATSGGHGVFGTASTSSGAGTIGSNTNNMGTGVVGSGNNQGLYNLDTGSGGAFTGRRTGVYSYYTSPGDGEGVLIQDGYGAQWNVGAYDIVSGGYFKIIGDGTISTLVQDLNNQKVVMHATETPSGLFEDYGIGKLVNGKTKIIIDPIFAKNIKVSDEFPMKVFIQLEGECNGVYVTNKNANSFEVIELQNGTSDASFSYSVVANRADEIYSNTSSGTTRTAVYSKRFSSAPAYQANAKSDISKLEVKK